MMAKWIFLAVVAQLVPVSVPQPCRAAEKTAAAKAVAVTVDSSGVTRLKIARDDLHVVVDGIKLTPGLGLNAWASVEGAGSGAVAIGEAALLESEVAGFLSAAIGESLDVTSLHNRFLGDQPRVMSLHFTGRGDAKQLVDKLGRLLASLASGRYDDGRRASSRQKPLDPQTSKVDVALIEKLPWKGELVDGVYRVSTGRGTQLGDAPVGASMGVTSWAAFAGNGAHAVVNGDLSALESELNDVLKALIGAHISVTSVHTHLTHETPRLMFVHFWGEGPLEALVKGVQSALYTEKNFRGSQ